MLAKENLNLMTIDYFVKVAENGNITKTAEKLFITQPVLSRLIQRLEKATEIKLFDRMKYGVELTEEGKRFYEYCKVLDGNVLAFCNNVAGLNGTHFYNLRVGYQKSSEKLMMYANSSYIREYPNSTLSIKHQGGENFKDMLRSHKLDIAFTAEGECMESETDLSYVHMLSLPQMLMVSKNNPLAQKRTVHFSKLRDEKWILPSLESLPEKMHMILRYCRLNNFEPNVIGYEHNYTNYIIGVVTNNAIAILPYMEDAALTNPQITFIPLDGFPGVQDIGVMWLEKEQNPAIQSYVENARTNAKRLSEALPVNFNALFHRQRA
jgi:DNA-binding transcriptional LysR family regulator